MHNLSKMLAESLHYPIPGTSLWIEPRRALSVAEDLLAAVHTACTIPTEPSGS